MGRVMPCIIQKTAFCAAPGDVETSFCALRIYNIYPSGELKNLYVCDAYTHTHIRAIDLFLRRSAHHETFYPFRSNAA